MRYEVKLSKFLLTVSRAIGKFFSRYAAKLLYSLIKMFLITRYESAANLIYGVHVSTMIL